MSDIISLLKSIQTRLYQIGGPILMTLGTISCILSLIIFNKKNLRKNPCSIYFTAYHLVNFLVIYTSLLSITLSSGYGISLSLTNLNFCRFVVYMALIGTILPPSFLILASIDRVLITSSNVRTRQRSTRRLAYLSTIVVTLFWTILHIHIFFLVNIFQLAPNTYSCYFTPGIYLTIISYYSFIIPAVVIPILLLIFGILTLKNLRNHRLRIRADFSSQTNHHQQQLVHPKDRQFVRILLLDISVCTIFILIFSFLMIYIQATQYIVKSPEQQQIEIFVRFVINMLFYIPYCTSLYTNYIGSVTFRKEVQMFLAYK